MQERAEFDELINDSANEAILLTLLEENWTMKVFSPQEISQTRSDEILKNILETNKVVSVKKAETICLTPWWRISVAIILILLSVFGAYLYFAPKENATGESFANIKHSGRDILPGTYSATLELSDRKKILLDGLSQGNIAREDRVDLKTNGKSLRYSVPATAGAVLASNGKLFNTLSTANGQNYSVIFSEGTQVWLNAGSSIKYPVQFDGDYRKVEITGEVEFEVTKNVSKPFSVLVLNHHNGRDLRVQVLGTHFKINSYPEEPKIKTTLLEGSVQLIIGSRIVKMKPGQQCSLDSAGEFQIVNLPDADKIVDLKSGLFFFKDDDINSVLRQIARWYDVELVYQGDIKEIRFSGSLQKSLTLNAVIKKLDKYVHLSIEDKKLVVTK